jgi:alpha-tubulin suppressor-like RCC1 family protein
VTITATAEGRSGSAPITVRVPVRFASIVAGGSHSCALTTLGVAWCWGDNYFGELGDGSGVGQLTPVPAATTVAFSSLAAGSASTCGLSTAGAAYCWGYFRDGGVGAFVSAVPLAVDGGLTFTSLTVGTTHRCGLTAAGAAHCWGTNFYGELGTGAPGGARDAPVPAAAGLALTAIAAGTYATCGLATDGSARCWGYGGYGMLGDGTYDTRADPAPVAGGLRFVALSVSGSTACGLTAAGSVYCWGGGDEDVGVAGDPTPTLRSADRSFAVMHTGRAHGCGLTTANAAWCWGDNGSGQLGDGAPDAGGDVPRAVTGGLVFRTLAVGFNHSCGVTAAGTAYCWGSNYAGQLGDGTVVPRPRPTRVLSDDVRR